MRFDRGSIALVLDAHTPFVPSAGADASAPLRNFFAEITQTYLPLLNCLDELAREEVLRHRQEVVPGISHGMRLPCLAHPLQATAFSLYEPQPR